MPRMPTPKKSQPPKKYRPQQKPDIYYVPVYSNEDVRINLLEEKLNKVEVSVEDKTTLAEDVTAQTTVGFIPEGTTFEAGTPIQDVITQMFEPPISDKLTILFWEGEFEPE